jgi:hypothetical protein
MHQAIEVARRLLNLFAQLVIGIKIEDIGDQIEGILIVLHLSVETSQVEAVSEVFLIDLAEVLVTAG